MLHIAVCDNEPPHLRHSAALIRQELSGLETELRCFDSGETLLAAVELDGYIPEIAVLDIELDGINGIALGRRLNELAPPVG